MDLTKYEKIDGREALDRMEKGEEVYDRSGIRFRKIFGEIRYTALDGGFRATNMSMNHFLFDEDWYIPKPFDVRQAMRDKPDKWVGKYEMNSFWYKVGFDTKNFMAVDTRLLNDVPTSFDLGEVDHVLSAELDACIPLEDLSANVAR